MKQVILGALDVLSQPRSICDGADVERSGLGEHVVHQAAVIVDSRRIIDPVANVPFRSLVEVPLYKTGVSTLHQLSYFVCNAHSR
jgi:hypothetical protein